MENKRSIGEQPWGYIESIAVAIVILSVSILAELIFDAPAPVLRFPVNATALLLLLNASILLQAFSKRSILLGWLSSIPVSVGAIALFLILSLTMALVPQQINAHKYLFIYNVTASWAYFTATAYLLLILGIVTVKRLNTFTLKNIGFFLNHFGLWLTIAAATFGSGDIRRLSMELKEGETVWLAYNNEKGTYEEMEFALKLQTFIMDEYPAKIAVFDRETGEIVNYNGKPAIFEPDSLHAIRFHEYTIAVKKHLMASMLYNGEYYAISDIGATQSYQVAVTDSKTSKNIQGWIGSANFAHENTFLPIGHTTVLAALKPEAKRYASKLTIYEPNGSITDTIIDVNRPVTIGRYKVYQTGYDESRGRWSTTSIVEAVSDPWIPLVYAGIFLMIAGSLYLIWFGRSKRSDNVE